MWNGLIRVVAGAILIGFSLGKFTRHEAEAASFERYGIPHPDAATYLVGGVELTCGVLLVLGLATRLAALVIAGNLSVAVATAGVQDGGPVNLVLAPALVAGMLALLAAGAGPFSLDAALLRRRSSRSARREASPS